MTKKRFMNKRFHRVIVSTRFIASGNYRKSMVIHAALLSTFFCFEQFQTQTFSLKIHLLLALH